MRALLGAVLACGWVLTQSAGPLRVRSTVEPRVQPSGDDAGPAIGQRRDGGAWRVGPGRRPPMPVATPATVAPLSASVPVAALVTLPVGVVETVRPLYPSPAAPRAPPPPLPRS